MAPRRSGGSNRFAMVGIPMLGFMVGGVYVLSTFMQTHVEMKDKKTSSTSQRKFDIEQEREDMMKKLDLDNSYKLSRIPRVDEENEATTSARQAERLRLGKHRKR